MLRYDKQKQHFGAFVYITVRKEESGSAKKK